MSRAQSVGPIVVTDGNVKVGRMVTTSRPSFTCPQACPFLGSGCYGTGRHWHSVDKYASEDGAWDRVLSAFTRAAKRGDRVARDRVLGDVVARDASGVERIDHAYISALMSAWRVAHDTVGRAPTVVGYTHAWRMMSRRDVGRIAGTGYVMNASCETVEDVRQAISLGMPTVVANDGIPEGELIDGHRVITCPEQTRGVHCADCGLCAKPDRQVIIRFLLHGTAVARARATVASLQQSSMGG